MFYLRVKLCSLQIDKSQGKEQAAKGGLESRLEGEVKSKVRGFSEDLERISAANAKDFN